MPKKKSSPDQRTFPSLVPAPKIPEGYDSGDKPNPTSRMAATALALVIAHHFVRLGQLDVTNYGDRTDFRSTRISCTLEVSGTETRSELGRRHRQKVAQALRNPLGWDAYVVVCAFSAEGHRIRLSFHHVQEPADDETPG